MSSLQKELESAYQRTAAAEAAAAEARATANRSTTMALEMERLTEENAVLGQRFDQMAGDLKCVVLPPQATVSVVSLICCLPNPCTNPLGMSTFSPVPH